MLDREELRRVASDWLLRWRLPGMLLIRRFFESEGLLEVHLCQRNMSQSAEHFWLQSVRNMTDFANAQPDALVTLVETLLLRPSSEGELKEKHEGGLAFLPMDEALVGVGSLQRAIILADEWSEYWFLAETAEQYVALRWYTRA